MSINLKGNYSCRYTIFLVFILMQWTVCRSSQPDECESTAKLLKVTERHLQDTGLLLSQIKEHKTCTSQALVDVKDLVDSLNEILPLLKTTPTPTATPESSKFQCPSLLDIRPPRDCSDIALAGSTTSGRYVVYPDEEFDPFYVFCDMDNDGGGWTVFQRRLDGSTNFFRTWIEYRYGFGQLTGEHWLGNDKLHRLTSRRSYELRVELEDFDGVKSYAVYDHFEVGDELEGYTMSLGEYNGTAGDSLSYHNGQPFTTRDHDNDGSGGNCAKLYSGAWWYQRCHFSNLNGKYYDGGKLSSKGATWYHWKNSYYSVKRSEMKIRPIE